MDCVNGITLLEAYRNENEAENAVVKYETEYNKDKSKYKYDTEFYVEEVNVV